MIKSKKNVMQKIDSFWPFKL